VQIGGYRTIARGTTWILCFSRYNTRHAAYLSSMHPSLFCRQLFAILKKNVLLKACSPLSSIIEICIPVGFMALLVYFKTLATIYDSPPIAYYCGQTAPWNYASSVADPGPDAQCVLPPDTCAPPQGMSKYYQTKVNTSDAFGFKSPVYYGNYGYMASGFGEQYPLYGLQVSDDADIYGYKGLPAQLLNPSPAFVEIMKFFESKWKDAGPNSAKIAILPHDATSAVAATDFYTYLTNQLTHYGAGSAAQNLLQYEDEAALER